MPYLVVNGTLTHVDDLEHSVVYRLAQVESALEIRNHLMRHQPLHLKRNSRQANHRRGFAFHDERRGGPVRVLHHLSATRYLCLFFIVLRDDESASLIPIS